MVEDWSSDDVFAQTQGNPLEVAPSRHEGKACLEIRSEHQNALSHRLLLGAEASEMGDGSGTSLSVPLIDAQTVRKKGEAEAAY